MTHTFLHFISLLDLKWRIMFLFLPARQSHAIPSFMTDKIMSATCKIKNDKKRTCEIMTSRWMLFVRCALVIISKLVSSNNDIAIWQDICLFCLIKRFQLRLIATFRELFQVTRICYHNSVQHNRSCWHFLNINLRYSSVLIRIPPDQSLWSTFIRIVSSKMNKMKLPPLMTTSR